MAKIPKFVNQHHASPLKPKIVAECWMCGIVDTLAPGGHKFYPLTIGRIFSPTDTVEWHRSAGHDVREIRHDA